jgi:hypothetical protein
VYVEPVRRVNRSLLRASIFLVLELVEVAEKEAPKEKAE